MQQAVTGAGGELAGRHRTGRDGAGSRLLAEVSGSGRADVSRPELARGRPRLVRGARRHPSGLHRPRLHRPARKLLGLVRLVAGRRAAGAARSVKPRCARKPWRTGRTGRTGQRKLARRWEGAGIRAAVERALSLLPRELLPRELLPRELLSRELLCRKLLPLAERPRTWRTLEGPGARRPVAGCGPARLPEPILAVARETNAIRHTAVCCSAVGPATVVLHTARSRSVGPARIRLSRLYAVLPGAAVWPVTRRRAALRHAPGKPCRVLGPCLICSERLLCPQWLLCPVWCAGHRRTILAARDRAARPGWPGTRRAGARRAGAMGPGAGRRHALPAGSAWHRSAWPAARVTAAAAAVRPAFPVHPAGSRPASEGGAGSVTWTHRPPRSACTGFPAPARPAPREILAGAGGKPCWPVARAPVVGPPVSAFRPGLRAGPEVGV